MEPVLSKPMGIPLRFTGRAYWETLFEMLWNFMNRRYTLCRRGSLGGKIA